MITYIIQEIIGQGYWSESYLAYKGYVFATHYDSMSEAINEAVELPENVTIITVY